MCEIILNHVTSTVEFKLVCDFKLKLFDEVPPNPIPFDRIARVHSTYFDAIFAMDDHFAKIKRKKDMKVYKKRRAGDDKTAFDSQVEISILSANEEFIKGERKMYKIKVFRTGLCSVPGVVNEDLSDLIEPMEVLRVYASILFNCDLRIADVKPVTRNYSAYLGFNTYPRQIWPVVRALTPKYVSVNLDALKNYLCCPDVEWADVSEIKLDVDKVHEVVGAFTHSNKKKSEKREMNSVKLIENKFKALICGEALSGLYEFILSKFKRMRELGVIMPSNDVLSKLAGIKIRHFLDGIKRPKLSENDNIFPYLDDDITKVSVMYNNSCLVIHCSGAVSIYGVCNDLDKTKISSWLSSLVVESKRLLE